MIFVLGTPGLTPADAWFCLLNDLRYACACTGVERAINGESRSCCYEKAEDSVEKQVWLRQSDCSRSMPSCMRTVRAC